MTACFWADDPLESADAADADANAAGDGDKETADPKPRCPRCDTPVLVVTCAGPTDHVATPCGCRVPGDLLECDHTADAEPNTDASDEGDGDWRVARNATPSDAFFRSIVETVENDHEPRGRPPTLESEYRRLEGEY